MAKQGLLQKGKVGLTFEKKKKNQSIYLMRKKIEKPYALNR